MAITITKEAKQCGINIEYIETNASWFKEEEKAAGLLRELIEYDINTLLISIDPFHNEYIPFFKTKGLMKACKKEGMEAFSWRMEEYEAAFGKHYELQLIQRYYLIFRGRALQTFKRYLEVYPIEEILQKAGPCTELSGVHHFHIDLYGNFIPQSCEGLSIHYRDLFKGALSENILFFIYFYQMSL